MEDADRRHGGLVVVDLGVGDAGVIVDDGVDERVPDDRAAVPALAAVLVRHCAVPLTLFSSDEPPPAAHGNVAELLHIDMDQSPGVSCS